MDREFNQLKSCGLGILPDRAGEDTQGIIPSRPFGNRRSVFG